MALSWKQWCKKCGNLHEDIGDFFGNNLHKKHLRGQCGRDIFGMPGIGNPLVAFSDSRPVLREVVGKKTDPDKASLKLDGHKHRLMIWPSTPAIFWSRDAPQVWGIRGHAFDGREKVIDDTFGTVNLDGVELDRKALFTSMLNAAAWMEKDRVTPADINSALELEDD